MGIIERAITCNTTGDKRIDNRQSFPNTRHPCVAEMDRSGTDPDEIMYARLHTELRKKIQEQEFNK